MIKWVFTVLMAFGGSISAAHSAELTQDQEDYITSNVIGIFYHELGHALIDILRVPIFGQEEDAADVLSILMVDYEFKADDAERIAYDIAFTFAYDAYDQENSGGEHAFWDTHGANEQRYFNMVCLFYGGDAETRLEFADDLELPEERADRCEEERALADDSWGPILEDATDEGKSRNWVNFKDQGEKHSAAIALQAEIVGEEVDHLNAWLKLPDELSVRTGDCDEVNAFYDPEKMLIIMCSEFAEHLAEQALR
jgi:hypothetical protein